MLGRALTFADPDVIELVTKEFIPVCTDDWYTRRRQDSEGDFFRLMSTAAGRNAPAGETRQGIYAFAADGTVLGYKNAGNDPKTMKRVFVEALKNFAQLSEKKRKPGGTEIPEHGKLDPKYTRTLPTDGLVLKVNARILDRKDEAICVGTCEQEGGSKASRDFLWLTKEEAQSLLPKVREVGQTLSVPTKIAERIARFHLVDDTRGEPTHWKREEIRSSQLGLTVTSASAEFVELRLDGAFTMATKSEVEKADRGFEVKLRGTLRYSLVSNQFDRIEITALGMHWGDHTHAGKARPGKNLLGVAFTLDDSGAKVPPQGIRNEAAYWGKD